MTSEDRFMMNNKQSMICEPGNKTQNRRGFFMMKFAKVWVTFYLMLFTSLSFATALQSVGYSSLPGEKAQLVLTFSESIADFDSFAIDEPARIVLDFTDVTNELDKKTQQVNIGLTKSVSTVEAGDRTRMVINLIQTAAYTIEHDDNVVMVTIDGAKPKASASDNSDRQVSNIDFRRGENGEAQLTISLSDDGAAIDVHQERDTIVVDLVGVSLPEKLHRRLDVIDFATPVHIIDSEQRGNDTQLILTTSGKFEHLAYQSENTLMIEVKPVVVDAQTAEKDQFGYKGEKLSLNFQNIEVRAVLQLLADFTGMNLVTSDTVQGNLTLRLKNVPWDQALDIILKTKGLAMRQNGNVMLVAPAAEISAREKQELESKRQLVELEPLYSELIEINFAKATELASILESDSSDSDGGVGVTGFISARGSVTVDGRTNSLLLRDTADQLVQIRKLIEQLDIPVRQVLIESRIVIANDDFTKELGVKFGVSSSNSTSSNLLNSGAVSGNLGDITNTGSELTPSGTPGQALNVNLPVIGAPSIGLALAKLPFGTLLQLELSALEAEGRGEIVSSPRVITSNQQTALIEQGTEVPYQEASSSGATSVSFKEAVLKLEVTPQITPDDHIVMDLKINKDEVIPNAGFSVPSISTKKVQTQVLVDNGETVVLGGIYEQTKQNTNTRVPFFGDLPYVGFLFKTTEDIDRKQELLIFVTPKIIKDSLKF